MGPSANKTGVLIKRGDVDREAHTGRSYVKMKKRVGRDVYKSRNDQGHQQHQKLEEGLEQIHAHSLERTNLPTP